jgi:hypothetical protein
MHKHRGHYPVSVINYFIGLNLIWSIELKRAESDIMSDTYRIKRLTDIRHLESLGFYVLSVYLSLSIFMSMKHELDTEYRIALTFGLVR